MSHLAELIGVAAPWVLPRRVAPEQGRGSTEVSSTRSARMEPA